MDEYEKMIKSLPGGSSIESEFERDVLREFIISKNLIKDFEHFFLDKLEEEFTGGNDDPEK